MDRYLARLCWSEGNWVRPLGGAFGSSYVDENGFGFEEWVNRQNLKVGNRRYAFVQGVSRAQSRLQGTEIGLDLFSISPDGNASIVFQLRRARVLSHEEAVDATRQLRRRGWFKTMRDEVASFGGSTGVFQGRSAEQAIVNISFLPSDLRASARPISSQAVSGRTRFQLYRIDRMEPRALEGSSRKKRTSASRKPLRKEAAELLLLENQMQNELHVLLEAQFGARNVARERERADLTVLGARGRCRYLIEVKSQRVPRLALREALGQVLEYAFYPGRKSLYDNAKLVVVGPSPADEACRGYVETLNENFGLKVSYRHYEPGSDMFVL